MVAELVFDAGAEGFVQECSESDKRSGADGGGYGPCEGESEVAAVKKVAVGSCLLQPPTCARKQACRLGLTRLVGLG